jgi:hypothetical protein
MKGRKPGVAAVIKREKRGFMATRTQRRGRSKTHFITHYITDSFIGWLNRRKKEGQITLEKCFPKTIVGG